MPILIPEQKKVINWFPWLIAVFAAVVIIVAVYYMFFAPIPAIEAFLPLPLQQFQSVTDLDINISTVINSKAFRTLSAHNIGLPTVGLLIRDNPFLSF